MNSKQLARLEYLDSVEFQTPWEHDEHVFLLHLQSEMQQAFIVLQDQGASPTWVGGEYIVANVPGKAPTPVHNLAQAHRLLAA